MKQYPSFIGIGGHKCASTWLSECMREHPDVFMSNPKELGFFNEYYDRGIDWYLDFFKNSKNYKGRGEFTATYLYDNDVPKRIFENLGAVKIVCLVRDPVDRTISHLKQLHRKGLIDLKGNVLKINDLKSLANKYPDIINFSLFSKNILDYQKIFGTQNVLIINQKNCKSNPDSVLHKVWQFLEVEHYKPLNTQKDISKGIMPKYKIFEKYRIKIYDYLFHNNPKIITYIKKIKLAELYRILNNTKGAEIILDEESINYLTNQFEEDWKITKTLSVKFN